MSHAMPSASARTRRRTAVAAATLIFGLSLPGAGPASAAPTVQRLQGTNRYGTAAAISQATFSPNVPVAYVATGDAFADALAGGPAAAKSAGPILLVQVNAIPSATDAELHRLTPGRIVVLGGPTAVSDAVVSQLGSYTTGGVQRIYGFTRYATSAAVSAATFAPGIGVAYVATGDAFADALAGGAVAGRDGGPILLVTANAIPSEVATELQRLHPGAINILGGFGAVSQSVEQQLHNFTSGGVNRIGGNTRYDTAVNLSSAAFKAPPVSKVFIATGLDFPDGLAGAPAAARVPGPVLLVPGTCVPDAVNAEINRLAPSTLVILGGPGAVSPAVESLTPCPKPPPPPPPRKTFGNGEFVVGGDIPSGTYRTRSDASGCYWERQSGFSGTLDDIITNNFTNFHDVVTIAPTDAGFKSSSCATWTNDLSAITSSLTAPFGSGTWIVNTDIGPGTWTSPGGGDCYWARLSGFSGELDDIITNDIGTTHPVVAIGASDAGFISDNCGTWTRT
jgi:putative cell wall-binding protein